MYDMENDGDIINKKTSLKHEIKHPSLSSPTFTHTIYSQSPSLPSASVNPLSSSLQCRAHGPGTVSRTVRKSGQSLSAQVEEYYRKYSRSSNLNQYFSLPGASFEGYACRYRSQMSNVINSNEPFVTKELEKQSAEISRGRRKWDRPIDIIGQSTSAVTNSQILNHHRLTTDFQISSPDEINKYPGISETPECHKTKNNSPTSSVASNRPLEWDNGADLGYDNLSGDSLPHHDCPSLLRSDPEGRTCTNLDTASNSNGNQINKLHSSSLRRLSKPDAHSTQAIDDETIVFGDNIQVTPITKSRLAGIITGHVNEGDSHLLMGGISTDKPSKDTESNAIENYTNIPKSSLSKKNKSNDFKLPPQQSRNKSRNLDNSLKKSTSMNGLAMSLSAATPLTTRSQSEFNLHAFNNIKDGINRPTNFYSTSSITTIVNKPLTCDKDIQTNINVNIQSKGVQVSDLINNINNNNNNEIIKNDEIERREESEKHADIEHVPSKKNSYPAHEIIQNMPINSNLERQNNLEVVSQQNNSIQSPSEYETDDGGRASNSFEYFPGDVYQNASTNNGNGDGTTSQVSSSMGTRISHSTMPNTSSSFDEKFWGDSGNLLRDLECSLHVLKSLVDANKCDKQVKKRLIHHVMKRLVTAKFTDDKIEHDLADNVPWNPDDTRTKVYRTEIIQALANKQKQQQQQLQQNSTADTDDDDDDDDDEREAGETEEWKVTRIRSYGKRTQNVVRERRKIIDLVMSTENSDIFEERNTDRTDAMQDGRKARMGLRSDDRHRHHHHHHHQQQQRKNMIIDMNKSESSECFLPQSQNLNYKEAKTFSNKPMIVTATTTKSQTSSATPNTTSSRDISSQCEVDEQRKQQKNEKIDWRLPTTISERRFDYNRSTSRLGTATRLIDYVEMEKKNQLVWINNEINHLSNLKKLLEEPKNYGLDNNKKGSPRKTNINCDKRSNNSTSTSIDSQTINKHWSSHGNIAERFDKTSANFLAIKSLPKRNSCTQTAAINDNDRFSRCNAADIAPTTNGLQRDTSNVRVQTYNSTSQSSRGTSPCSPRRHCHHHNDKRNYCRYRRPSSLSPRRCHDKSLDTEQHLVSQPEINSNKDAKNLLNDQCKLEFNDITENQDKFCRVHQQRRGCCYGNSNSLPTFCKTNATELANNYPRRDTRNEQNDKGNENNMKKIDKSQEIKCCRVCGTVYSNDNKQCQCKITYMKPIAYELSFEDAKKPRTIDKKKLRAQPSTTTITLASHEPCITSNCSCSPTQLQLKDYLTKNKPEFVDNIEMRKRYMNEITQLRQLKKEKRKQLLAMASPNSFIMTQKTIRRAPKSPRKISDEEMRMRLRMRYLRLSEVRNKRRQREKEEQTRRNHLMAKIFCKKLQQKVLEGQVDVSQSVSVISNL
ncbi:hypothetical protein PV327_006229 [Microctonus hyperodae]|uniref:ALMS motif domain-containing protein n=1 Tax=Microctonus hyperodae TaxID=165561 RepID=A0AA39F3X4_MICHY|nr:hypothetical protein PV327_006229 [Microctonus hyperodae]